METYFFHILLFLVYGLPAYLMMSSFIFSHFVALKKNDIENIMYAKDWPIVILGSFTPLFNFVTTVIHLHIIYGSYVEFFQLFSANRKHKKLVKQNPHILIIDLLDEVKNLYQKNIQENRGLFNMFEKLNPNFPKFEKTAANFHFANKFVKKNQLHPEIKKIIESNEMPFSYILSLFTTHQELLKHPDSETFQKVYRLLKIYIENVKQVEKTERNKHIEAENAKYKKSEEEKRLANIEKEKQAQEELLLLAKAKERVDQELDIILEVVEHKNAVR